MFTEEHPSENLRDVPSHPPQPHGSFLPQDRAGSTPGTPSVSESIGCAHKRIFCLHPVVSRQRVSTDGSTQYKKRMNILSFLFSTEIPDYPVTVLRGLGSNPTTPGTLALEDLNELSERLVESGPPSVFQKDLKRT